MNTLSCLRAIKKVRKTLILIVILGIMPVVYAQRDSLSLGERYLEDQIYLNISYNVMNNQPASISASGLSYGVSLGYLRDIPFNKKGNWAAAVGLGYGYDRFNHQLAINQTDIGTDFVNAGNILSLHNVQLPVQFRWRTSDANTFSFWRIYTGITVNYNFSNRFKIGSRNISNVEAINTWQTDFTFSAGYSNFNVYLTYGLTPLYKNAEFNNQTINTRVLRLGLSFYLL